MPIPHSDRVLFESNPLVQVICELRFPVILRIDAQSPVDFQERVRNRYPHYRRDTPGGALEIPTAIVNIIEQMGAPSPVSAITHRFADEGRDYEITMGTRHPQSHSFVGLTSYNYTRWEDFRQRFIEMEEAFSDQYQPADYSRIGLRYVNELTPALLGREEPDWNTILRAPVAGILHDPVVGTDVNEVHSVASISIGDRVPEALMKVNFGLGSSAQDGKTFTIDSDCSLEGSVSRVELIGFLDRFNVAIGDFFRWCITDDTRNALRPTAL